MSSAVLFIFLFLVWLLLTFSLQLPSLLAGAAACLLVTALMGKHAHRVKARVLHPHRYLWAVAYLFIFLWECVKANLDVAYRVLHPGLPVKPGIVKARTSLVTDVGKTFLANSITMTPGTITVDIAGDYFYIHWIYVRSKDPEVYTHQILGRFEKYLKRIFE